MRNRIKIVRLSLACLGIIILTLCYNDAYAFGKVRPNKLIDKSKEAGDNNDSSDVGSMSRVVDMADLLSDEEETKLSNKIQNIHKKYDFDIVIVTTQDTGDKSVMEYADDYYDDNGYGVGSSNDGMLFLISMEDRDYWTSTTGSGINIFTDYGIGKLGEAVSPYLTDGEYYKAFDVYLSESTQFIDRVDSGKEPYDYDNKYITAYERSARRLKREGIVLVLAIIIAGATTFILSKQLDNAKSEVYATSYVKANSFMVKNSYDRFIRTTVARTARPKNDNSSGGSSTHTASSGTSHGGGGGKF